jgi:predicted O-methyltransferase YrrM
MNILKLIYQKSRWQFFWGNFQLPEISILDLGADDTILEPQIEEELCLPPYKATNDHNDIDPLLRLIVHYRPKTVLELGTAQGATAANICAVCDAKVYTVNALPEQIGGGIITFVLKKDEIGYVYRKHGFAERVQQIYENTMTMDLEKYVPVRTIDFAIIDACHDTDFVTNDFLKVFPFLAENAVVLFHDVSPSLRFHLADSYVACMYLRRIGFNIRYIQNTWWAIWQQSSGQFHLNVVQRLVIAMENLFLRVLGFDARRDAAHIRWLASVFVTSKLRENGTLPVPSE